MRLWKKELLTYIVVESLKHPKAMSLALIENLWDKSTEKWEKIKHIICKKWAKIFDVWKKPTSQ